MSRRKQLNPKPLLKGDCENSIGEIDVLRDTDEQFLNSNRNNHIDETMPPIDIIRNQSHSSIDEPPMSPSNSNCSTPPSTNELSGNHNHMLHERKSPSSHLEENQKLKMSSMTIQSMDITKTIMTDSPKAVYQQHSQEHLPKLRLNTILASDPALLPEAKDIKIIHATEDGKIIDDCDQSVDDNNSPPVDDLLTNHSGISIKTDQYMSCVPSDPAPSIDIVSRVPGFMCGPCGIKFSSLSTLEAHQTYYCTHRKEADVPSPSGKVSADDNLSATESSTKCVRTGKQYACSQCSYSADKKVSLNRHMRMHQASPTPSSVTSNGDDSSSQIQQIDRYCTDCDIRFSSTKTYRAHKQHYCSSRHRDGTLPVVSTGKSTTPKGGSISPPEVAKSPPVIAPPQPYLALPTNPIVIIPCSLIRGASVLPGPLTSISPGTTNPDLTCFILKTGSLQPIAHALTVQPSSTESSNQLLAQNLNSTSTNSINQCQNTVTERTTSTSMPTDSLKPIRKKENNIRDTTTPLDLSVRRLSTEILKRDRSSSFSSSLSGENPRVQIEIMMEGKENLSIDSNSVTPEQIVCAPSLPGSPPLTPSPKRNSHSPRGILAGSPNLLSPGHLHHHQHHHHHHHHHQQQQPSTIMLRPLLQSDISTRLADTNAQSTQILDRQNVELALRLQSTTSSPITTSSIVNKVNENIVTHKTNVIGINKKAGSSSIHGLNQPQIFVKQGVSKCKECNIVFCRYENYVAHKKHYCSARNLDDKDGSTCGGGGGGGGSGVKPSPPPSPLSSNSSGAITSHAYQQLICAACGIKFTSLDNLSAHQTYYCPKRIELPIQTHVQSQKEKCTKCKTNHDSGQPCPLTSNPYKCPICDVVSANASESRRHIETHAGVKAFRCSICRYKGNTLRGMRTHIRMHFDKKSNDFNEEHFISCILEEDGLEIPPAATQIVQDSTPAQLHCCDKCNYSSSYKGNVVRHIKLVHSQAQSHSTSPSFGEGGESLLHNDDTAKVHTSYNITIKTEPSDEQKSLESNIREPPLKIIKLEAKDTSVPDELTTHRLTDTNNTQILLQSVPPIVTPAPISLPPPPPQQPSSQSSSSDGSGRIVSPDICSPITSANDIGLKYCNVCDIKFNYLNTFIAHKKFYCKNAKADIVVETPTQNPSKSPVISRAAETPVL